MKKRTTLLLFSVLITLITTAQDWSSTVYQYGHKYPGYIIKNNGEKVDGYIEAQQRGSIDAFLNCNQNRVIFFTDPENKKTKVIYTPDDLKGYMIADKYYKSMHYSGGLVSKPMRFLLQVSDGHIAKYVWYTASEDRKPQEIKFNEQTVYQKGDEMPIELSTLFLNFAEKVSNLVSEDVELSKKVLNKEKGYGKINIENIIAEYNEWYKTNNK